MKIFTCFTLRYIKPMIENIYLILFLHVTFFRNIKSDWKFCATLIKVKFSKSRYNKKRCGTFLWKVTFRRKKQINRLLLILHEIACFFPIYNTLKWFFMNNNIMGTFMRISAFFVKCFLLYLKLDKDFFKWKRLIMSTVHS